MRDAIRDTFNGINQGTANNERIGRDIFVKSIEVRYLHEKLLLNDHTNRYVIC